MGHWGKAKKRLWEGNVFGIYWLQLDFKGYPKSPSWNLQNNEWNLQKHECE